MLVCHSQPVARMEHRKILEVRVRVADEEARENPAQQPVGLRRAPGLSAVQRS